MIQLSIYTPIDNLSSLVVNMQANRIYRHTFHFYVVSSEIIYCRIV